MSHQPPPKPRQFSLRALLFATVLAGLTCGWFQAGCLTVDYDELSERTLPHEAHEVTMAFSFCVLLTATVLGCVIPSTSVRTAMTLVALLAAFRFLQNAYEWAQCIASV